MAEKSYRKATEKEIKRGAKKTTDELSKAEALKYFKKRSEDTGSKRFRWRGDVYDLEGNKIGGEKKSKSSAPEKSSKPVPRPERKTNARPMSDSDESKRRTKPKTNTEKSASRPMTDADEVKRRAKPRVGSENRMGAADVVPLAAAAGAARRGGARHPTGTGRPMIGQRPIPFDSGVSRSTEIIPSRTPRGGNMYMLNPGGGPTRLGGPMEEARRPRLMAKGGMVKKGKKK